jgi:hypothetical protein
MTSRDLLKEAIADAKAVKETAIANAKLALEESFTPFLREKLALKLEEMDKEDEELNESKEKEEELKENESIETNESEDELDLNELLKELDEVETSEEMNENEDPINDPKTTPTAHGNVAEDDSVEDADADGVPDDMDSDVNVEDMTTEELEEFIQGIITDMVKDGSLKPEAETEEEPEEGGEEVEAEEEEEEISVDELLSEIKKVKAKKAATKKEDKDDEKEKLKKDLKEAYDTLKIIKKELNEVNIFNAKLLYTTKIFRNKNLSESQKVKVLAAFDKAASKKEAKLVYETLNEGLKTKKPSINESTLKGSASKVLGIAPKKPILEVNDQYTRMQILAGIKK